MPLLPEDAVRRCLEARPVPTVQVLRARANPMTATTRKYSLSAVHKEIVTEKLVPAQPGKMNGCVQCGSYCALGVGVYFWAKILTPVAKQRYWSQRNCQLAGILIVIPGCLLFLSGGSILNVGTLLVNQALFTGLLLSKSVYPNAGKQGPFEKESPATLLPK
jgi:hypothetical protein